MRRGAVGVFAGLLATGLHYGWPAEARQRATPHLERPAIYSWIVVAYEPHQRLSLCACVVQSSQFRWVGDRTRIASSSVISLLTPA
jgi:hypothetical protein